MLCQVKYKMKPPLSARLMPGHPLARGLVGYWLMLEGAGTILNDLSGNDFDGTKGGTVVWEPGKFGSANHYDGSSGYHDFGNPTQLQFLTGDFTFLALVNVDSEPGTWWTIGGRWSDNSANRTYCLATGTGDYDQFIFFVEFDVSMKWARSTTSASSKIGKWVQVIGVKKGVDIFIYINGVLEGTDTGDAGVLVTYDSNFFLGRHTDAFWDGLIDHSIIWNRGLSASEIGLLHREPFCMFDWEWLPGWAALAGEIKEVSGTIAGVSSVGVTAKRTRNVAGSLAGIGALAASAKRDRAVSGTIPGQSNVYGSVEGAEENAILLGCNF